MISALLLLACVKTLPPNAADDIDTPAKACIAGDAAACEAILEDAQAAPGKLQLACDSDDAMACKLLRKSAPIPVALGAAAAEIGGNTVSLPENPYGNIASVRSAVPNESSARAAFTVEDDVPVRILLAVMASVDREGVNTAEIRLSDGAATLQVSTPERLGARPALTREQVQATFLENTEPLRACYLQALADQAVGEAPVRVLFQLQVAEGIAEEVSVASMSTEAASLEACLIDAVSTLPFPASAAPTSIRFPFTFQPD